MLPLPLLMSLIAQDPRARTELCRTLCSDIGIYENANAGKLGAATFALPVQTLAPSAAMQSCQA
jgi:hypothetical protein